VDLAVAAAVLVEVVALQVAQEFFIFFIRMEQL
jgi:hypothetical protein